MKTGVVELTKALVLLAGLLSFSPAVFAETRVALVIGNGAYVNTTPLGNPLNDARDMAAALAAAGFDVVEAYDADKRRIDQVLRVFTDKVARADVALFYYAGHGLQVGAQNYLVPVDATLERERDLEFEAVKLDFVLRQMEIDRDGKTSIVFLDACRDNPLSRNLARSMGTRSAGVGRGLAAAATGLGTFISYATQPGNVALDGDGRNSPFTSALIRHMRTAGHNLPATMIEVRKDVVAATNGRQVPWDHSSMTADFYFVPSSAAASSTTTASTATVAAPGAADFAALQDRLRRLEEEAKHKDATAGASAAAGADAIKLAELRARAANLEDLTRDLQRKFMNALTAQARITDKDEKAKASRDAQNMQMELGRRNLDLSRLKAEIATLEAPRASKVVFPAPVTRTKQGFHVYEGVSVTGDVIKSGTADSADGCLAICRNTPGCAAAAHGAPGPKERCVALSRIDAVSTDAGATTIVRSDP